MLQNFNNNIVIVDLLNIYCFITKTTTDTIHFAAVSVDVPLDPDAPQRRYIITPRTLNTSVVYILHKNLYIHNQTTQTEVV